MKLWLVVGIAAVFAIAAPFVLSPYALTVAALVTLYAVAALAQDLLTGETGVPSFGNVVFFATGAYVAGSGVAVGALPPAIASLLGVLAGGAVGVLLGVPSLRLSGMHLAIVTVVAVFVSQEVMQGWDAARLQVAAGVPALQPGWLTTERPLYAAAVGVLAATVSALWSLRRSRTGRAFRAQSSSGPAALACGVQIIRYRVYAFVMSGMLTALAGVVYLYYARTVTPGSFTLDLSLAFLAMIAIGGTRSLVGPVLGAAVVGLLPEVTRFLPAVVGSVPVASTVSALWAMLLLGALWLLPGGLWNALRSVASRAGTGLPETGSPPSRE